MRLTISIIFTLIIANNLVAQDYAEFNTDTSIFIRWYEKENGKLPQIITEQVWYINSKKMRYGSGKIKIKVNSNKLDTIIIQGL